MQGVEQLSTLCGEMDMLQTNYYNETQVTSSCKQIGTKMQVGETIYFNSRTVCIGTVRDLTQVTTVEVVVFDE